MSTYVWNKDVPSGTSQVRHFPALYASDKSTLQALLEDEHYFTDGSSASAGEHKLGSARIFSGASSAVSASGRTGGLMWDETNSQLVAVHAASTTRLPALATANTWAAAQTFSAAVTCSTTLAVTGIATFNASSTAFPATHSFQYNSTTRIYVDAADTALVGGTSGLNIQTNSLVRATMTFGGVLILGSGTAADNATAGGARFTGIVQHDARVIADHGISTDTHSVSVVNAAPVPIYDLSTVAGGAGPSAGSNVGNGFIVTTAASDSTNVGGYCIVTARGGAWVIEAQAGTGCTFTISGNSLEVTQTSGSTKTMVGTLTWLTRW